MGFPIYYRSHIILCHAWDMVKDTAVSLSKPGAKIFAKIEERYKRAKIQHGERYRNLLKPASKPPGFQLFQRVGNPIFASYLGHLPTYLLFLVDFLRKTNLPTYYKSSYFQ